MPKRKRPDSAYVPDRRYPARPIVARFTTVEVCAEALATETRTVHRWLEEGVSVEKADMIAIAMGCHPVDLWPDFYDNELDDTKALPPLVEQEGMF